MDSTEGSDYGMDGNHNAPRAAIRNEDDLIASLGISMGPPAAAPAKTAARKPTKTEVPTESEHVVVPDPHADEVDLSDLRGTRAPTTGAERKSTLSMRSMVIFKIEPDLLLCFRRAVAMTNFKFRFVMAGELCYSKARFGSLTLSLSPLSVNHETVFSLTLTPLPSFLQQSPPRRRWDRMTSTHSRRSYRHSSRKHKRTRTMATQ